MRDWSPSDPGCGDLSGLEQRISRLVDHRDHASDMKHAVLQVAARASDHWSGDAYDAWLSSAEENGATWLSLHHWADNEYAVLSRYVAAVESIKERAARQRAVLIDALTVPADESDPSAVDSANRALAELAQERREVESALARGLAEVRSSGGHPTVERLPSAARLKAMAPVSLLALLASLTPQDLERSFDRDPDLARRLAGLDPTKVATWWSTVETPQALIDLAPAFIGSLDGIPPAVRVAANRIVAARRLADDQRELLALRVTQALVPSRRSASRIALLQKEMSYLRRVEAGDVQLYLYDPDASRIVEMIGTPGPETKHVITYVPGTFTNLNSFYDGQVQQVARFLRKGHPLDAVALVYKDGLFPGENDASVEPFFPRIVEANDVGSALRSGKRLASFESGLNVDPFLSRASHVAIGHSWGLANITSAEVAGADYNKVMSLSGAFVPHGWIPHQGTSYDDFSYDDTLQVGQRWGIVKGTAPRETGAFDHNAYYAGPDGMGKTDLHNLVAGLAKENQVLLRDLAKRVYGK